MRGLRLIKRDSMVVGFDLCSTKTLALLSHDEAMLAQKGDATYDHKIFSRKEIRSNFQQRAF